MLRLAVIGDAALAQALAGRVAEATGWREGEQFELLADPAHTALAGCALALLVASSDDDAHRRTLLASGIAFSVVADIESALDAATPLLLQAPAPRPGLFTRLAEREAALPAWTWTCEKCDVPECEHAALRIRGKLVNDRR